MALRSEWESWSKATFLLSSRSIIESGKVLVVAAASWGGVRGAETDFPRHAPFFLEGHT